MLVRWFLNKLEKSCCMSKCRDIQAMHMLMGASLVVLFAAIGIIALFIAPYVALAYQADIFGDWGFLYAPLLYAVGYFILLSIAFDLGFMRGEQSVGALDPNMSTSDYYNYEAVQYTPVHKENVQHTS